jgi:hypothetical protein
MVNVYKDGEYVTIGTDKGVYLVGYGKLLAFKPSTKQYGNGMYIDKGFYDSFTQCSNEFVNKCADCVSRFCGRTSADIITRVNKGEFAIKDLQDLF